MNAHGGSLYLEVHHWHPVLFTPVTGVKESGDTMENILLLNIVQYDQFDQFVIDCLGKHIH